jgi:hypothetical protein
MPASAPVGVTAERKVARPKTPPPIAAGAPIAPASAAAPKDAAPAEKKKYGPGRDEYGFKPVSVFGE